MEMSSSSERASSEGDGEDVEAVLDCFKGNKWLSMNTDTVSASEKAKRQVSCTLPTALARDHTHTYAHTHTRGHDDGMNIQALHLRAHSLTITPLQSFAFLLEWVQIEASDILGDKMETPEVRHLPLGVRMRSPEP
jgi:hypothetical protein